MTDTPYKGPNFMENSTQEEKKDSKKRFLILIILLGVLTCFSAFSGYVAFVKTPPKMEELKSENDNHRSRAEKLQSEIDKVNSMLEGIGFEASAEGMENFKEEQLALRAEAEKQKKRLEELQSKMNELLKLSDTKNADDFIEMYRKIKAEQWALNNEVNKLRRRNKELIAENQKLEEENKRLAGELDVEKGKSDKLAQKTGLLEQQIRKGAALHVYDLSADGIRVVRGGREKVTTKARKAEKLRVGFTLPKNDIASPGLKTVYMVITGPDKMVITDGGSNFNFEGKATAFTSKDQIEYTNDMKDMVMYGKNLFKEEFDEGEYTVDIYCEGSKIGTTKVELR